MKDRSHKIKIANIAYTSYTFPRVRELVKNHFGGEDRVSLTTYNIGGEAKEVIKLIENGDVDFIIIRNGMIPFFEMEDAVTPISTDEKDYLKSDNLSHFKSRLLKIEERKRANQRQQSSALNDEDPSDGDSSLSAAEKPQKQGHAGWPQSGTGGLAEGEQAPPQTPPESQIQKSELAGYQAMAKPPAEPRTPKHSEPYVATDAVAGAQQEADSNTWATAQADSSGKTGHFEPLPVAPAHNLADLEITKQSEHPKSPVATKRPGSGPNKIKNKEHFIVATSHDQLDVDLEAVERRPPGGYTKLPHELKSDVKRFRVTPEEDAWIKKLLGDIPFSEAAREVFVNGRNLSDFLPAGAKTKIDFFQAVTRPPSATRKSKKRIGKYEKGLTKRFRVTPQENKHINKMLGRITFSKAAREVFLKGRNLSDVLAVSTKREILNETASQLSNLDQIAGHEHPEFEDTLESWRSLLKNLSRNKFQTPGKREDFPTRFTEVGKKLNEISKQMNTRRALGRNPEIEKCLEEINSIFAQLLKIYSP